jgi:hypothetical protein
MKSLAPYTRAMLRGSRRGRGYNSTSAPPSRVATINAERLRPRCPPSPQPADIPSAIYLFIYLQPFIGYGVGPNRVISSASASALEL